MPGGYAGKFLDVDLTKRKMKDTTFDDEMLEMYFGGQGSCLEDSLGPHRQEVGGDGRPRPGEHLPRPHWADDGDLPWCTHYVQRQEPDEQRRRRLDRLDRVRIRDQDGGLRRRHRHGKGGRARLHPDHEHRRRDQAGEAPLGHRRRGHDKAPQQGGHGRPDEEEAARSASGRSPASSTRAPRGRTWCATPP